MSTYYTPKELKQVLRHEHEIVTNSPRINDALVALGQHFKMRYRDGYKYIPTEKSHGFISGNGSQRKVLWDSKVVPLLVKYFKENDNA